MAVVSWHLACETHAMIRRFSSARLLVAFVALLAVHVVAGCTATAFPVARATAATTLSCPAERFETFVPHHYNLAPNDYVFRGCGRDVIVRCVTTSAETLCRPTHVQASPS